MKKKVLKKQVVIYQAKSGAIELRGDADHETIWATQAQIVSIFDIDQSVVSRHVNNILKDREVDEKRNMQKMHIPNSDKLVVLYSLDIILAVGYRANSTKAITFRQWATQILRQHITKGYTINSKMVKANYAEFLQAVDDMKALLPGGGVVDGASVLELVTAFAATWFSLDAYDRDALVIKGATKRTVQLTAEKLMSALTEFKNALVLKGEASDLFGKERNSGAVAGIVGNVMQMFGGAAVYPTVEEKAAHLLYFMVKNHPFTDGNKRSGAYAFVWFLKKAGILDQSKITPPTLTALTLFVAESDPKNKDRMVRLVMQLLV